MYCKYCGAYVDSDSTFCSTCGERIGEESKVTGDSGVREVPTTNSFPTHNSGNEYSQAGARTGNSDSIATFSESEYDENSPLYYTQRTKDVYGKSVSPYRSSSSSIANKKINGWAIAGFIVGLILFINIFNLVYHDYYDVSGMQWLFSSILSITLNAVGIYRSKKTNSGKGLAITGLVFSIIYCISVLMMYA